MKRKIGFAIIGFGHIGKRHATFITEHEESNLVAICDEQVPKSFNCETPFFTNIEDLFKSGIAFDVLVIATPNGFHAEHAIYALERGKHVLIEKPIALTKSDAERIIFKALHVNRYVFAVMQNRYSAPAVWLNHLMRNKILGQIFMVQINCFWNRDERYYTDGTWHGNASLDGGTLFTQFSHFIDMLFWLFGDITNIQSRFRNFSHLQSTDFEDSGLVTFDFVAGGIGSFNFSTAVWNSNLESTITIIAENGSVKIGGQYINDVQHCSIKNYEMPSLTEYQHHQVPSQGPNQNHRYIINNVVDVLNGRDSISVNAMDGLKVCDIIERIYLSGTSSIRQNI